MRALIIGPDEKRAIRKVVAFASDRKHWYEPEVAKTVPGDNQRYVVHVPDGFRCVFTITRHKGELWRHLSVSVPSETMYPSPEASVALAKEFGFTSSGDESDLSLVARMERDGWMTSKGHKGEHCIVLVQPVEETAFDV